MTICSRVSKPTCLVAFCVSAALLNSSCAEGSAPTENDYAQTVPGSAPDAGAPTVPVPTPDADAPTVPGSTPDAGAPHVPFPAQDAGAPFNGEQVPCRPWQPSNTAWSSLPTSRPAVLGTFSADASGKYLYSVGTWWDAGNRIGGIVRSPDLGETWCVITTPAPIVEVATSPISDSLLYAMTERRDGEPAQLLRTTDGGATWTDRSAVPETRRLAGRLATGSLDSETVWIGDQLSLDGGETWTGVLPPALDPYNSQVVTTPGVSLIAGNPTAVVVEPQTGRKLLAHGEVTTFFTNGEIKVDNPWFKSEDAGETWQEIDTPSGDDSGAETWDQVVVDVTSNLYAGQSNGSQLYRSSDWGVTWDELPPLPSEWMSIGTLGASQGEQLFAWGGGSDTEAWRSVDAGTSWQPLTLTSEFDMGSALATTDGEVIVGKTPVGLAVTTNGGDSWQQREIIPLSPTLFASPYEPEELFTFGNSALSYLSSTDDGLTWMATDVTPEQLLPSLDSDKLPTWVLQLGYPRGVARCARPATCLFVLLDPGPLTSEQEPRPQECYLARTDDGGKSFGDPVIVPVDLCRSGGKLAVSPTNEQHLLIPCNEGQFSEELVLKMCTSWDGGLTWASNALGVEPSTPEDNVVSAIFLSDEVVLATTGLLLSGSLLSESDYGGEVRRSTDGGITWSPVLDHGGSSFTQSTAHPETVFLTAGASYSQNLVFRSDDAGLKWNLVSPGGPVVNPDLDNEVNRPSVFSIVDRPGGGFLAVTDEGFVQFN
jgi:photosystem II stability/assembly factor-like uncharacterized protein